MLPAGLDELMSGEGEKGKGGVRTKRNERCTSKSEGFL